MKQLYLIRLLTITFLIFTSCSPKEMFSFSRTTASYVYDHGVPKEVNLPDNFFILAAPPEIAEPDITGSPILTSTRASATNLEPLPLPRQSRLVVINASISAKKVNTHPYQPWVENRIQQKQGNKRSLTAEPTAHKPVHGVALAGFILSLTALVLLLVPSFPFVFLFVILSGLIGFILSIIGLRQIVKNPAKYAGKGFAWVGIIVGLSFALFIVGFLWSWGSQ